MVSPAELLKQLLQQTGSDWGDWQRSMVKSELLLLFRRGIIPVYLFITIIYVTIVSFLSPEEAERVVFLLVFTDVSGIGFFFVGAVMQWEKREGVAHALFVTPLSPNSFLLLRTGLLSLISLLVSAMLFLFIAPGPGYFLLLVAVSWLGAIFFTLLGIGVGSVTEGVNSYFILAVLVFLPFAPAYLSVLGIWWHDLLLLLPTGAMAALFLRLSGIVPLFGTDPGTSSLPLGLLSWVSLALWIGGAALFGATLFKRSLYR
jgi:hypothetical protein